jgi:GDP-L-fucose synthase
MNKVVFKNTDILVTGGGGMIGRSLVKFLLERGANITIVDLTVPSDLPENVKYIKADLRYFDQCVKICENRDYIFNLVGIKGSPKMCAEQPVDFMVPMLQFNTNMMEAAYRANVKWYLYTSSVGVYAPAEVFFEDTVWSTMPSPNDRFAGWAKRIGELQAEAYGIQYGKKNISIVRPANVYGAYDNFNPANAMVVPSLIRKAQENNVLEVWGDGSTIRDFIHADDVALGMINAVEKQITQPINLGSGKGYSIKEVVEMVVKYSGKDLEVKWLTDKPAGDKIRLFDVTRAKSYGINISVSLEEGIKRTTEWFLNNKELLDKRYNAFVNH